MMTSDSYLSYFTPGQMSHDTLEFILVKRQPLIERLVKRVRSSVLTGAKHHSILLGPRGMGKSHVVALVYYRVKKLPELADKVALAWLAEEEWGVASLTDLFLVILKVLGREYPDSGLQAEVAALYRLPVAQIENVASQKLREFCAERTLFLLVENLQEIFRGLGEQGQWAFRSFLSEHPFITILATTPSLFNAIQKKNQAFYGFFNETYLDELSADEASELLGKVAERRGDTDLTAFLKTPLARDRVQAVHDLAGGHPRIYLLFAHLITEETLDELVTPFLQLLDELTPYYQSRMQLLAPQQRKIAEYLCDRRGAVTVKVVAEDNLLSPQASAAQLGELERMEYVRKTGVGRESFYELREPLLRMVVEVKRGRGEPIRLVVDFLRRWYSRDERRERLKLATSPLSKSYWEISLNLDHALQDTPNLVRAEESLDKLRTAYNRGDYKLAVDFSAEVIERKGSKSSADDWFIQALCLSQIGDYAVSLSAYNKTLQLDPDNFSALVNRCVVLSELDDYKGSIIEYDNLLNTHPGNTMLLNNKAVTLYEMCLFDEALFNYDKALEFDHDDHSIWFNKATVFLRRNQTHKFMEAINKGFALARGRESFYGNTGEFCRLILSYPSKDEGELISRVAAEYADGSALSYLITGLTSSISTLFEPEITQDRAEAWLVAWEAAAEGREDLTVPLRLLRAAVAWKPKRDPRALLALAIEERRILEQLLPKDAAG